MNLSSNWPNSTLTKADKESMSRSFSLGVRKIWDELAVMQAPGFYWVNIERQIDANLGFVE